MARDVVVAGFCLRRREIAIRTAPGASTGLGRLFAFGRSLGARLIDFGQLHAGPTTAVLAASAVVWFTAAFVPARQASLVDPMALLENSQPAAEKHPFDTAATRQGIT